MSIFKKTYTRPVPPDTTITTDKRGRRTAKWTDGRGRARKAPVRTVTSGPNAGTERIVLEASKWTVRVADAAGGVHERTAYTDKDASKALEADLIRRVERGEAGITDPYEDHRRRALTDHLDAFHRHLEAKGGTRRHVDLTLQRCRRVLDGIGATSLDHLDAGRIGDFLHTLRRSGDPAVPPAKRRPLSVESANHHLRALRSFCRWLVRDGRLRDDPTRTLSTTKADANRRHVRRALTEEELSRLVEATRRGPDRRGLSGEDRAMLYLTAAYTGLRASELASLTPAAFDFSEDPPVVRLAAASSKHREDDILPLRSDLAEALRSWIGDTPPDAPLWPGRWARDYSAAKILRRDLEAAGVAYRDASSRVADFHSLRVTFCTALARSGTHPKVAQDLARHTSLDLTMKHYTHVLSGDLSEAVESLPAPPADDPAAGEAAEADLRRTGTDDAVASEEDRGTGRDDADPSAATGRDPEPRSLSPMLSFGDGTTWQAEAQSGKTEEAGERHPEAPQTPLVAGVGNEEAPSGKAWQKYAREDSNPQPSDPKSDALSC